METHKESTQYTHQNIHKYSRVHLNVISSKYTQLRILGDEQLVNLFLIYFHNTYTKRLYVKDRQF